MPEKTNVQVSVKENGGKRRAPRGPSRKQRGNALRAEAQVLRQMALPQMPVRGGKAKLPKPVSRPLPRLGGASYEQRCVRQFLTNRPDGGSGQLPHVVIPRDVPTEVTTHPTQMDSVEIPYLLATTATSSTDPRIGMAGLVITGNAQIPYWHWAHYRNTGGALTAFLNVTVNNKFQGLMAASGLDADNDFGSMEMDNADALSPYGYVAEVPGMSGVSPTWRFKTIEGDHVAGLPVELSGADVAIAFQVVTTNNLTAGNTFSARLHSATGSTAWQAGAAAGANNQYNSGTITFVGAVATLGGIYGCCTPDSPLGVQIRFDNGTVYALKVTINYPIANNTTVCQLQPQVVPYEDDLNFIQKTSCTGMNPWVFYSGAQITASGKQVAAAIPGGIPVTMSGYAGPANLSTVKGVFSKEIRLGAYGTWRPFNKDDIDFHSGTEAYRTLIYASLVWWGNVGVAQGASPVSGAITLNLDGEHESTTTDRTRPVVRSPADPEMLARIIAKAHAFPPWVENPMHWGDIKSFLRKTWGAAKHVASFVNDNKGWILPALGAVAAVL